MPDAHKNFAYSTVLTAPSPATSGTSLVVQSGDGAKFPAVPFNATICPATGIPTTTTAEIVRVTAISTDTFTITRAQESSSARTVVVGDQIAATITAQTLTDVEAGARLTQLSRQVLSSTQASFSFTSIDQGYSDLRITLFARGDNASTSIGVFVRFNNDSGANYDDQRLDATGAAGATTGETQAQTVMNLVPMPAASAPANVFGEAEYWIANYAETTSRKSIFGHGTLKISDVAGGISVRNAAGYYRTAGAVTRVDLLAQTGNFTAASVATLYGVR